MGLLFEIFHDDATEIVEFSNYERRLYTVRARIDHMAFWGDHEFELG